jgi:uncharacterized protein
MSEVHLAPGLSVPAAELATKIVATLGMRGSGKSNEMAVIAEQLLAADIQVIVLDDVGIHFSLRLAPSGKSPSGLNIPVLGGRHGDIPLLPTAGELVAKSLAETGSSAVLDISSFRKGERARFAAAFAETLLRAKQAHPGPCFLILEESQRWIPQVIRFKGEGEERMLGAFMDIAEVGRNYGLGMGLVSQRPQKIHKEVLNLTELLFAFQTNGVHERKALADWVQETGAEGRDKVGTDLPSLQVGEALVWSPSWLRLFKRYKLPKKTTYDAGATPLTARDQVKTKPLELGKLSEAMAAVTEAAKANDPKALQAEVARLKRELAAAGTGKGKAAPAAAPKVVERIVERIPKTVMRQLEAFQARAETIASRAGQVQEFAEGLVSALKGYRTNLQAEVAATGKTTPAKLAPRPIENPVFLRAELPVQNGTWRAGGGALRSLQALASTMSDGLTWRQVATLAGMKASGGGFGNIKSALRIHGCVEEKGERVFITEAGRVQAGNVDTPLGGPEVLAFWARKLPRRAVRMLEAVIARGPGGVLSRAELASAAEMEAAGGGFGNYVSLIRTNGLVEDREGGFTAADVFFR